MEAECVHISLQATSEYSTTLSTPLDGVPLELLLNMDELGHANWSGAHSETVPVPQELEVDSMPVPVSRTGKRITLIGCMCTDGSFISLLLIIQRRAVDADLRLFGIFNASCRIGPQTNGFVDCTIFEAEWRRGLFPRRQNGANEPTMKAMPS
jgi:hypothetical protein